MVHLCQMGHALLISVTLFMPPVQLQVNICLSQTLWFPCIQYSEWYT